MTMQKLANAQTTGHAAYHIKKMIDHVNQKMNHALKEYKKEIGEKYGKLSKKGEIIQNMENDYGFELLEGVDEFALKKEIEAYGEKEVIVNRQPLTLKDLEGIRISAAELGALEGFVEDPEATEHLSSQQGLHPSQGNQARSGLRTV